MLRWDFRLSPRRVALAATCVGLVIGLIAVTGMDPALAEAPRPPLRVTALVITIGEIDLRWSAVFDENVTGYAILRNGTTLATVNAAAQSYIDGDVKPSTTYTYTLATIAPGNIRSLPSAPAVVKTPAPPETTDLMPPSPPDSLTATPQDAGILLDWYDATDDTDITAYQIRRDGLVLASVNGATLSFFDFRVRPSTTYSYTVEALDVVGHHSQPSNLAVAKTASFPADDPPNAPAMLTATPGESSIALSWSAVISDTDLAGYDIRRNGTPLAHVISATLSFTDTDVLAATTYTYTVEAVDIAGNRSPPSPPATATLVVTFRRYSPFITRQ
jgi:fibronectin type 3 domain-containing protein